LRSRFGLSDERYDESTRIIIAALEDMEVGLIVDGANDVLDIPIDAIEPQPEVVGSLGDEYITGVAKLDKRLLIMLSLQKIFN
jgi:purine-binding chemotaxis protein CheW